MWCLDILKKLDKLKKLDQFLEEVMVKNGEICQFLKHDSS